MLLIHPPRCQVSRVEVLTALSSGDVGFFQSIPPWRPVSTGPSVIGAGGGLSPRAGTPTHLTPNAAKRLADDSLFCNLGCFTS